MAEKKDEKAFEITEHIGDLSTNAKGWTKELNLVSWYGREPKYDIREWSPDHSRTGKGVTLSMDEFAALKELIGVMGDDSFDSDEFDV